jgi:hypothetical protein
VILGILLPFSLRSEPGSCTVLLPLIAYFCYGGFILISTFLEVRIHK